jgi:hypothetical protein
MKMKIYVQVGLGKGNNGINTLSGSDVQIAVIDSETFSVYNNFFFPIVQTVFLSVPGKADEESNKEETNAPVHMELLKIIPLPFNGQGGFL